jgi:hypothetical protein
LGSPWCHSRSLFDPVSAMSAHRTTRRNASRSCSMRPNPLHGVGARFSQVGLAGHRRKPVHGAGSCRWHSDPNRAVPARMTMDARGRFRPSEAPPAVPDRVGAGGRHRSQKLHRQRTFFAQRSTARCLGIRDRPKRARLISASPDSRSWSANSRDSQAATHRTTVLPHHVTV